MKTLFALSMVLILSNSVLASGPDYITEAILEKNQSCDDGSKNCIVICYRASTAFGESGGCSTPQMNDADIQNRIDQVKEIFSRAKANNKGKLAFGLEENYKRGESIGKSFSVSRFLQIIIDEDKYLNEVQNSQSSISKPTTFVGQDLSTASSQ